MAKGKGPKELSDAELARMALSGERAAFGELVERHAREVAALAYAMVGDREKARDLAQESFLAAYQSLGSLREPARFGAWLAGIARRQCIYAIRRERRSARALEARAQTPTIMLPGPEGSAAAADEEGRMLSALNRLGRRYREVLVLRHLEGRSYAEIGQLLGLGAAAVEKRLGRARNMLRAALEVKKT